MQLTSISLIKSCSDGKSPLHRAASNGDFKLVEYLVKSGAIPNIIDK